MSQEPAAVEADFVAVDEGRCRLFVEIRGEGTPLLLIHGWPFDHRLFTPQADVLAREFRVIGFDRRGFGRSEGPADLSREVEDIAGLLRVLRIDSAHVLGVSQGGRIALRLALRHPAAVRSLVLLGAAIDGWPSDHADPTAIPLEHYAALARAGRLQAVRDAWLDHPMMAPDMACPRARELAVRMLADYAGRDLLEYAPEHYRYDEDVLSRLERIACPVLVMTGAKETRGRQSQAELLLRRIPAAREKVLARSGHLANLVEPGEFNRAVLQFCRDADRAPGRSALRAQN